MDTETWTLDELARRAGQALAADAVHAPNGRVRERPDGRAIRWYATIGLVDRPFTGPGRAARYGPRHLLQLVAVKRLQALGRSLAQIQAELTGATDATLRRIARLPSDLSALSRDTVSPAAAGAEANANTDATPVPGGSAEPIPVDNLEVAASGTAARFWAAPTAPTASTTATASANPAGITASLAESELARSSRAAGAGGAAEPEHDDASVLESHLAQEAEPAHEGKSAHASESIIVRYELVLSSTVSLSVPHLPAAADLEAIREAAAPLLHLLADRGLTTVQGVHDEY